MRTYCIAETTPLSALWWPKWKGNLKRGHIFICMHFPGGSDCKESACNAGEQGSLSGSGRSSEKWLASHSSILACRIPWTGEPGGLPSVGHSESDMTEWLSISLSLQNIVQTYYRSLNSLPLTFWSWCFFVSREGFVGAPATETGSRSTNRVPHLLAPERGDFFLMWDDSRGVSRGLVGGAA